MDPEKHDNLLAIAWGNTHLFLFFIYVFLLLSDAAGY